jgi:hypothetical protein
VVADVACNGGATGSVTFDLQGGTAPYTMSINNGRYTAGKQTFEHLVAGTYLFKVQDSKGCAQDTIITVNEPAPLQLKVTAIEGVTGAGRHDAKVTVQATGGVTPYSYSATGMSSDYSIKTTVTGLGEGMNYVYVKDANGCSTYIPVQVAPYSDENETGISLSATVIKKLTCSATADAEVEVSVFGGQPPYRYSKDGGMIFETTNILTGFGEGQYTITVKDGAGKSATIDVMIEPAVRQVTFTANITKWPDANGTNAEVTVNAVGGSGVYEYQMNTYQWVSTHVFSGLNTGTHTFTVRDAMATACEAPVISINIPYLEGGDPTTGVAISASVSKELQCAGDSDAQITVAAVGGTDKYQFSIDNRQTFTADYTEDYVFTGLKAGTYTVAARDNANPAIRSNLMEIVIAAPAAPPTITAITSTEATCGTNNATITVDATGGSAPLRYSLTGVQWTMNKQLSGVSAGNHDVWVNDTRGCVSSGTVTVTAATSLDFTITALQAASSAIAEDGQVTIEVTGGRANYEYVLTGNSVYKTVPTTSATAYTFPAVKAGSYTVSVVDAGNCSAAPKHIVLAAGPEQLSIMYSTQNPTCHGSATGAITVSAYGGMAPYSYSLDDKTYGASNVLSNLTAGTYTLYIKDAATPMSQKTIIANVVLTDSEQLIVTAAMISPVSGAGASDAIMQLTAKGGTAPYEYSINGGSAWFSSGQFKNLGAGSYTMDVRDKNGCTAAGVFTIPDYDPNDPDNRPAISASIANHPTCYGERNGAIAVSATGGRAPYSYSVDQITWFTNEMITGLAAGTYTVYAKEITIERITAGPVIILGNPLKLTAEAVVVSPISAPGAFDGRIKINAGGGKEPYQYSIDGQYSYQYGAEFSGLFAQLYTFHVKDANGCLASTSIRLADPGKITISAKLIKGISCNGTDDAIAEISASGTAGPYEYRNGVNGAWSSNNIITGLGGGSHALYVRDVSTGISDFIELFIEQPMPLMAAVRVLTLPTSGEANGSIGIIVSGGSGNYNYFMNGAPVSSVVNGLATGTYTFTIEDASAGAGCVTTVTAVLSLVDVILNKNLINLHKEGPANETYTVRLSTQPVGNVVIEVGPQVGDRNDLVLISPTVLTFTPSNWNVEQDVTVSLGNVPTASGVNHYATRIVNRVTSCDDDLSYAGIDRIVIVNVSDNGSTDRKCADFEALTVPISFKGTLVGEELNLCSADAPFELITSVNEAVTYRWLKDNFLEVSQGPTLKLQEGVSGLYKVMVLNANNCVTASETVRVNQEIAPDEPTITGNRFTKSGMEQTYTANVANMPNSNLNYRWHLPYGYTLASGSFDTDPKITVNIGDASSTLRVEVANLTGYCPSRQSSISLEVMTSYGAEVYPSVIDGTMPYVTIQPKDMTINRVAVMNMVGQTQLYSVVSGHLPCPNGNEIRISMANLSGGHYFIVLYGDKGEVVSRQVIKN